MTKAAAGRLIRVPAVAGTVLAGMAAQPGGALAAPAAEAATAQGSIGTLPLLAALAIGIAVAVGAVVAFLQMTAKGKEPRNDPRQEAGDSDDSDYAQEEFVRDSDFDDHDENDRALTDFTIPLTRIPVEPLSTDPAPEGQPRLCGVSGEFTGASFQLNGSGLSIGRDPAVCHVVFPLEIGEVSRRHCTLSFERDRGLFMLEDHGSSNGTFLPGGRRLQPGKRYELRSGERFALSGATHWFEVRD